MHGFMLALKQVDAEGVYFGILAYLHDPSGGPIIPGQPVVIHWLRVRHLLEGVNKLAPA